MNSALIRPTALLRVLPLLLILLPLSTGGVTGQATPDTVPEAEEDRAPPPAPGQIEERPAEPPPRAGAPSIRPGWEDAQLTLPPRMDDDPALTVTGTAEVEVRPDRARILLAVETEGETAREAGEANADLMTEVVAAVRTAGEEVAELRVETSGYSLSPRYGAPRADRSREIVGYTARNTVQVQLDEVEPVGGLIDAALDAGANRVSSLHFEVRDAEPHRHEAVAEAVRQARAEAEVMAQALGMQLGRPIDVQGGADMPFPRPMFAGMERQMEMADAAPTPVEPGLQTVSARVTIRFRLNE